MKERYGGPSRSDCPRQGEGDRAQMYLDVAQVILVALDADGRVTLVNRKGREILGRTEEELIGRDWFETCLPADVRDEVRGTFERIMAGELSPVEFYENPVCTKDGVRRLIAWHNAILRDAQGRIEGTISSGEDITEQKRLEEQLRQAAKMEAIGQLAGGIAHDFNNLLTAILGEASLLRLQSPPASTVHKAAETIERAAERAAQLTGHLLSFARKGPVRKEPVDLHRLIGEVTQVLSRTLGEKIRIVHDLRASRATVLGDAAQIEQVLLNLAVNARDAMPHGGELTFATDDATLDAEFVRAHPGVSKGPCVRLRVRDTGCGMSDSVRERIFEPFFTTKKEGKGTGMGLAVAYGVVRQHGGTIEVESRLGHGATFTILWPLRPDGA